MQGESGVVPIQGFDAGEFSTRFAGEIQGFACNGYVAKKMERRLDSTIKYIMVSGKKVPCPCMHPHAHAMFVSKTCKSSSSLILYHLRAQPGRSCLPCGPASLHDLPSQMYHATRDRSQHAQVSSPLSQA